MQQQKQEGHGRGGTRAEQTAPPAVGGGAAREMGVGMGLGMGMGMGMGMGYGHMAGPQHFGWGYGYHHQPMPPFPTGPVFRPPTFAQEMMPRPTFPLGMQNNNSGGALKRAGRGPSHNRGRGYSRGYGGRYWGGRGRGHVRGHGSELLTREALDADLDKWRMKDKKSASQSLDADLDEYWSRKEDESDQVKSEPEDSPDLEKRDSLDVERSNVPKRTIESGSSLRPSKTMRNTDLNSGE